MRNLTKTASWDSMFRTQSTIKNSYNDLNIPLREIFSQLGHLKWTIYWMYLKGRKNRTMSQSFLPSPYFIRLSMSAENIFDLKGEKCKPPKKKKNVSFWQMNLKLILICFSLFTKRLLQSIFSSLWCRVWKITIESWATHMNTDVYNTCTCSLRDYNLM